MTGERGTGLITQALGRLDAALLITNAVSETLIQMTDLEKSLWEAVEVPLDHERHAAIEESLERMKMVDANLRDAFDAIKKLYPSDTFD